jgi:tripartite-type tricarboxylate transporter receptor subunit TctC
MLMLSRTLRAAGAAALIAAASAPASGQTYPNTTVRLIVPVPAGGVTDTMARIVAQRLGEMWGQSVIVDNRPGGNYGIGAQAVSRSPADGYNLLVAPDSTFTATVQQTPLRPQGVHADHGAVPRVAGPGGQFIGSGE